MRKVLLVIVAALALLAGSVTAAVALTTGPAVQHHAGSDPPFAINVTASPYNAKCDGSTDDTTAFTSALAAFGSTGGQLQVPASANLCKVMSTIHVPNNVEIVGESPTASVIWGDFSTGPVLQFGTALGSGGGTTETDGGLRDLGIDGNSASGSQIGVDMVNVQNLTLDNTYVKLAGVAYKIDGGTTGTFSADVTMIAPKASNVTDGIDTTASGGVVTDLRAGMGGYLFGNGTGYAVHATNLNTSQFWGLSAEKFSLGGIYFDGTSSNNDVFGTRVEQIGAKNDALAYVCSGTGTSNNSFWEPIDADTNAPGSETAVHNINSSTGCDLDS
jgi:hypothetical protein